MHIREEGVNLSNATNEQNFRASNASGNEVYETSNPELRNRRRQPSNSPVQPNVNDGRDGREFLNRANQNNLKMRNVIRKRRLLHCFYGFLIIFMIISLMVFYQYPSKDMIYVEDKEETNNEADSIFENVARMADFTSKELSELDIPGSSVMNKYRAVFLNLGAIVNKSDVIVQNGAQIARDLFELSADFNFAGHELSKFMNMAENFFDSLSIELNAIRDRLDKLDRRERHYFANYFQSDTTDGKFIQERLKVLESKVPGFRSQLKDVIDALRKIEERVIHTQGYLITGEKEAQKVLNDHWLGKIANYEERKRAEEERRQVLHVLELLRNMMPNLLDFESFLDKYREQLQDVQKEIKDNRARLKPSKEAIEYLTRAVKKLENSHMNFINRENKLGQKPKNTLYLEDEMNAMHRDCTEFNIEFNKPNNVYLKKIRIWSSNFINAIAFFHSDDSIVLFGTPGSSQPFDFEWQKYEKIKRFEFSFASVVYGLEITTNRGRSTGWRGGNDGHRFYTEMEGREFNGLFGSFSKYICSLEVSHGYSA